MSEEFANYKEILPDWVQSEADFEHYKIMHTTEHVFNQAVEELWPGKVKRAVAHIEKNRFSSDGQWAHELSPDDLPKIEVKMQEIIKRNLKLRKEIISVSKARELFKDNPFKLEWIDQFSHNAENISVYWTGDQFVDLCKGPHVNYTKKIKAFKLLGIAGAYWRGDESNEMLTRVYGIAFGKKADLEKHLKLLEEAKERDHRKVNEYMDIFTFSDLVGRGLVMYTPRGTIVKNALRNHLFKVSKKYGAKEVNIPHMAKIDLYELSGHAKKFKDELFKVTGHYDNEYVLKPVNCPHHTQIYAARQRSYKDLPLAFIESTQQHRDEKPGAMSGLNRTISFEVDDGHTFCRPDQIKTEATKVVHIIREFYSALGMWGDHWVSLSFRDPNTPEKYIGKDADWELAQSMLLEINEDLKLRGKIMIGEAALYGPKIDFMLQDALGNDRQLGTVQIDFAMPQNFGLTYIDQDGQKKTPVMLHRAILGSYQRFISYLMESTKGAFPVWLAPEHVRIIPISDENTKYSDDVRIKLFEADINVELDTSADRMQNKIRKAQEMKVPYMLIIGKKEEESGTISVRLRTGKEIKNLDVDDFVRAIRKKIDHQVLELDF